RLPCLTLQRIEVALQIAGCRGPVYARRSMTGYRAPGLDALQSRQLGEPALQAAIERGNPLNEQQIRQQQCPGLAVQNAQVTVRMSLPVGGDLQNPAPQIDLAPVLDQLGRLNDGTCAPGSEDPLQPGSVILATLRECIGQQGMPYEPRLVVQECAGPKD